MPPPPKCNHCQRNITAVREKGITCAHCEKWYHQTCSGLTVKKFDQIYRDPAPHWFCDKCLKDKKDRRSSFLVPTITPQTASAVRNTPAQQPSSSTNNSTDTQVLLSRLERLEKLLEEERVKFSALNDKFEELKRQLESSQTVTPHSDINSVENCLEIRNIPLNSLVDPLATAIEVGTAIGCQITEEDIECTVTRDSKPVLSIKFASKDVRANFLSEGKKFNREGKKFYINAQSLKIFINEKLTIQQKQLHYKASSISKANGYKFCWWSNGKLLIKQSENHIPIAILDDQHLERLFTHTPSVLPKCSGLMYEDKGTKKRGG